MSKYITFQTEIAFVNHWTRTARHWSDEMVLVSVYQLYIAHWSPRVQPRN